MNIRGYAWLALKELDPGLVTQSSETFNATYNPAIMKWLKPSFNYTSNYRWSDDLTREGQNVSTQLRFGSNFNIVPVQIIELVYKPKKVQGIRLNLDQETLGLGQEVQLLRKKEIPLQIKNHSIPFSIYMA